LAGESLRGIKRETKDKQDVTSTIGLPKCKPAERMESRLWYFFHPICSHVNRRIVLSVLSEQYRLAFGWSP
jgi:hypothetical protein